MDLEKELGENDKKDEIMTKEIGVENWIKKVRDLAINPIRRIKEKI
jgi:hypothetical protein